MNNQQLPPGYSANDIVTAPNNQQASQPQGQGLPPGYSPDDIVQKPNIAQQGMTGGKSDEIQAAAPDADLADKAAHAIGGTFEGIGEGVFGAAGGITDLLGGKDTGISKAFHHLAGDDNDTHGTAQNVGRGIETIGEFILGDAALQGLSFADKLKNVSSIMKFIEKSPRLAKALQLGINVGKAGAELSPEERAVLKQYPTLARLAGLGLDSVRAGVVQGGQTLAHGGTLGQATEEGAGMAAGSALLGAPLAALGGVAAKGAEAAKTAEGFNKVAETAPTAEELSSKLEGTVKGATQPKIDEAQKALDEAQSKQAGIESVAQSLGEEAPTKQAITAKAQGAVQSAHTALNNAYEDAASKITSGLKDTTISLKNSNLHKLAEGILVDAGDKTVLDKLGKDAKPNVDPLKDVFDIPNPVSDTVKGVAKRLYQLVDKSDKEPVNLTADGLLDYAKKIKENLRNTGFQTAEDRADRDAYFKMLDAIHNDFYNIAEKSGKPEMIDALNNMNSAYKEGIARFKNPDVKKILEGKSEGNILKLLQGTGSVKDIQTIKGTIGKGAYSELVDNSIQRMAADSTNAKTGEFDFGKFFKNWNSIDPEVRSEMLEGSTKGGPIELAMNQMKKLNANEVIPNSETTIKEAQKFMDDLLGNGNVTKLINNPDKVQALKNLIGPDAMGELGKSVMQNQLREAATDATGKVGRVDFNKLMKFVEKFKDQPELVESLFRPTPETAKAYDTALEQVKNVQGVKNMLKLGVIAPGGLAVGATVGHLLSHPILGMLVAAGGEKYHGGQLLEYLANHPATWRILKSLDTAAKKPLAQGVNMLGKYAAGKAGSVAAPSLLQQIMPNSTLGGTQ
jgi:hypothetical protein